MKQASFLRRLVAAIFDIAIINLAVMLISDLLMTPMGLAVDQEKLEMTMQAAELGGSVDMQFIKELYKAMFILSILSVLIVVLIDAVLPATKFMSTPGKKILGMVIVDEAGQPIGYGKSFGRHAAKFVSAITVIGFLMPLWNAKRQALHDKMSGTLVVRTKSLGAVS